jgi:hypothetical protein
VDRAADTRSSDFSGSKIMAKNKPFELKPFQPGQIWEVADMSVRIDLVGKTLIHYKRYKGKSRAVPTSFSSRKDLEKYLKDNKAVLVRE